MAEKVKEGVLKLKKKGRKALNIKRGEVKIMVETKTSGKDAILIKQGEGM